MMTLPNKRQISRERLRVSGQTGGRRSAIIARLSCLWAEGYLLARLREHISPATQQLRVVKAWQVCHDRLRS
jgi:hypothetical protein